MLLRGTGNLAILVDITPASAFILSKNSYHLFVVVSNLLRDLRGNGCRFNLRNYYFIKQPRSQRPSSTHLAPFGVGKSETRPTCSLGSGTSRFIIFQDRFPLLQLYSGSNVLLNRHLTRITDSLHTLKMTFDSCIFHCAMTNSSVNTAIPSHESVQQNNLWEPGCNDLNCFHEEQLSDIDFVTFIQFNVTPVYKK